MPWSLKEGYSGKVGHKADFQSSKKVRHLPSLVWIDNQLKTE
jgi:hypothetical protein